MVVINAAFLLIACIFALSIEVTCLSKEGI
jgi:hypothetical protein